MESNLTENTLVKTEIISERNLILIIALVQFINILDFMMVMPLGPDFAHALGIPTNHIGYIGGAYTLAAAISGFCAAFFLDKFQRKTVLAFSLLGLVIATALGAAAWDSTSLICARIIAGVFGGPLSAVSLAIISDRIPPERRGSAMGKVMGSFAAASVLGVPFGLELSRMFGWRSPFLSLAMIGTAILIFIIFKFKLPERDITEKISMKVQLNIILKILNNKLSIASLGFMGLSMMAGFMIIPNISAHLQLNMDYPREKLGMLYFCGGFISFFGMRFAGKLVDKYTATLVSIIFTTTLIAAIFFGFIYYSNGSPIILIFVLFMFSMTGRSVCAQTLSSEVPPPAVRGAYMSLQSSVTHIFSASGAFLSSVMLTQSENNRLTGIENVGSLAITISLFIPLLFYYVEKNLKHKH